MRNLIPDRQRIDPASDYTNRGDKARDQRDWDEAESAYRQALIADGSMGHIWVQLGHALKEQGKLSEAEEAYRRGVALDPHSSDAFLQLGHLLKLRYRSAEALESYKTALSLNPDDATIKREIKSCERTFYDNIGNARADFHVYFDISDMVYYIGHHDSLSGIQRVQASVLLNALKIDLTNVGIHFLSYVNPEQQFYEIKQSFVVALLEDLPFPPIRREITFDRAAARVGYLPESSTFVPAHAPSNVLCLIGAGWVNRDYSLHIRNLKAEYGLRFVMLVHDMIPVYARDTCDQDTAESFIRFLLSMHHLVDSFLCVSEHTRSDLVKFFARYGLPVPGGTVTQEGSGLARDFTPELMGQLGSAKLRAASLNQERYILFVSTIEGRKNHLLAYRAMEELLRRRGEVPYLVCVGRLGWRSEEFLARCGASSFLRGRIKVFADISDSELVELYRRCLFTIYPSLYEGWGLPVGESLSFGKLCITSNAASLPEVGGNLVVYVDPHDPIAFADAIEHFLDDGSALEQAERRIRDEYQPIQWKDVAARILSACRASAQEPEKTPAPMLELAREYPMSSAPKLPDGLMGERMAAEMWTVRRRLISNGLFEEADYRDGQNARSGAWCEPEIGLTWARVSGCALSFCVEAEVNAPLVLYVAYEAAGPCVDAVLTAEVSGGAPISIPLGAARGVLAIPDIHAVNGANRPTYRVALTISGADDIENRLSEIDPRCPAVAIRSFVILQSTDVLGRLALLERIVAHHRG